MLGDILKACCVRAGLNKRMNEQRLLSVWEDAVGEGVAKRAEPIRIRNQVLYLKVANSVWMQQLQFMKGLILEKLHQKTGTDSLRDIRFFIGDVTPFDREEKKEIFREVLPSLTEADRKSIISEVSGLQDAEMQKILSGLYSKALATERNRGKRKKNHF